MTFLFPGDKLKGAITGQPMGTVIKSWRDDVLVRLPDGTLDRIPKVMVEVVPS